MTLYILVKYLHFMGIFGMVACLAIELALVKGQLTRREIKRIAVVDGIYGISAIVLVAAGITLWVGVGKGQDFYDQPAIYIKLALAILAGILSIWPTVYFLKNRKGEMEEVLNTPSHLRRLIIVQLVIIGCVPPLATMLAYGIRLF